MLSFSFSKGNKDENEDEVPEDIELSALQATFLHLTLLDGLEICPELRDFVFANDGLLLEPLSMAQDLSNDGEDKEPIRDFTTIDVDRLGEDFFNDQDGDFGGRIW